MGAVFIFRPCYYFYTKSPPTNGGSGETHGKGCNEKNAASSEDRSLPIGGSDSQQYRHPFCLRGGLCQRRNFVGDDHNCYNCVGRRLCLRIIFSADGWVPDFFESP
jgi:hypothetical protein